MPSLPARQIVFRVFETALADAGLNRRAMRWTIKAVRQTRLQISKPRPAGGRHTLCRGGAAGVSASLDHVSLAPAAALPWPMAARDAGAAVEASVSAWAAPTSRGCPAACRFEATVETDRRRS